MQVEILFHDYLPWKAKFRSNLFTIIIAIVINRVRFLSKHPNGGNFNTDDGNFHQDSSSMLLLSNNNRFKKKKGKRKKNDLKRLDRKRERELRATRRRARRARFENSNTRGHCTPTRVNLMAKSRASVCSAVCNKQPRRRRRLVSSSSAYRRASSRLVAGHNNRVSNSRSFRNKRVVCCRYGLTLASPLSLSLSLLRGRDKTYSCLTIKTNRFVPRHAEISHSSRDSKIENSWHFAFVFDFFSFSPFSRFFVLSLSLFVSRVERQRDKGKNADQCSTGNRTVGR